ncbi:MAG: hypothetical protein R3E87_26705 [Burkholderiaceae bacterium]
MGWDRAGIVLFKDAEHGARTTLHAPARLVNRFEAENTSGRPVSCAEYHVGQPQRALAPKNPDTKNIVDTQKT